MLIDKIQKLHLVAGGIPAHFRFLNLLVQPMKVFLNFQKHFFHLGGGRPNNGLEQTFLVLKAGIDGAGAGACLLGDGPKGSVRISFFKKFLFCAGKYGFIYAFNLFCHGWSSFSKIQNSVL